MLVYFYFSKPHAIIYQANIFLIAFSLTDVSKYDVMGLRSKQLDSALLFKYHMHFHVYTGSEYDHLLERGS